MSNVLYATGEERYTHHYTMQQILQLISLEYCKVSPLD